MMAIKFRRLTPRLLSRRADRKALNSTLYGGIGGQVTLLVTGVVVARALGPSDRGHFALLTLVWAIATSLGGLGIPHGLSYFAARAPEAALQTMRAVTKPLAVQLALATLITAIVLGLLTAGRPDYVQWGAAVSILTVAPWILLQCGISLLQGLQRFAAFNVLRVLPNAGFAVAATTLLMAGVRDFLPFVVAWGLSRAGWAPVAIWAARHHAMRVSSAAADRLSTSQILGFGRRSLLGASPPMETYRLDQAVVALFLPPAALGYYVVSLAFTTLPRMVAQSFGLVASPRVASSETHSDARRAMWGFFWLAAPVYAVTTAVIWIVAPELTPLFFGEEFEVSIPLTRSLLVATVFYCARRVLTDSARGAGYPGVGSLAEILAFVCAAPLLAAFVPLWGIDGVAYALIGSSLIALAVLVVTLMRAGRNAELPSAWREMHSKPPVSPLLAREAPSE